MGFKTPYLIILLLVAVAAGDSTSSPTGIIPVPSQDSSDQTTDDGELKPSASTDKSVFANSLLPNVGKMRKNDDNDVVAPEEDVTMDELMLFESLIADETDVFDENNKKKPEGGENKGNAKLDDIDSDSTNPMDSKLATESEGIHRQGDVNPAFEQKKPGTNIQFDDSKQEATNDPPTSFGQRSRNLKPKVQDEAPVLQLTQGGYDRPFKRSRFRNRYASRPDSSEQSEKIIQEPNRSYKRQQEERRVVPQVAYSAPPQPSYNSFASGPVMRPAFESPPRNVLAINHIIPTTVQNGFLNTPPAGFADYPTTAFQAHFPPSNDVGGFPNFGRDPNNVGLYQSSQRNPFADTRLLFQAGPQVQTQPILIDPTRNVPSQFQPNAFSTFPNFENVDDNARPDYASYFRTPTANPQFQVPPNFYGTNPNGVSAFNNPPISFLSNHPNSNDRFPTQFFRYPVTTEANNRQQNFNDQQPDSDASQEDKKSNVETQDAKPANNDEVSSIPFGTRLLNQNEADVYIRYPTNEAGYATEENLPPRNSSEDAKDNGKQSISEERNLPNADSYRNDLNSRTNHRRNISYEFPSPIFGDVPIDFGYQRPPNQIFMQHRDRNRGLTRFPSQDFNSRSPFDPITSLPENNYQFLNAENQRRGNQEFHGTPTCAKENNASICFEDNEYPRNDIVYSLNSNSFLADRLSGPELPLDSIALVEQNASLSDQTSDNYACAANTIYGSPLRAKNLAGVWRVIVSLRERFLQPVRLEVCKSLGDACNYADSRIKTTCVQKYNLQRLLTWSPDRGIYSDIYKLPVACSCQILEVVET